MSVYKKLMQARINLQNTKLTKTGHNKFAGYKYFELGDFLPAVQQIFNDLGLCGTVSYTHETATLTITDTEDGTVVLITSPMSSAALKGAHDIQNLGAVQTYLRRYLWVTAMEIVEHDALDATLGSDEPKKKPIEKPAEKPVEKPVDQKTDSPWAISVSSEGDWSANVTLGVTKALEFAQSKNDVLEIFKVNKKIFDALQANNKATYDDLVAVLGNAKKKFEA